MHQPSIMHVTKRNGERVPVSYDKIRNRVLKASAGLQVDPYRIAKTVIDGLFDGVTTHQLDELAAETAAGLTSLHPDYSRLAAAISISTYHKETDKSFVRTMKRLYRHTDPTTGQPQPMLSDSFYETVKEHGAEAETWIDYQRDFKFDFFGFRTLRRQGYLLGVEEENPIERPQHMYMRVALALWGNDLEQARKTYELLSTHQFTHATPTLFNAGVRRQQLSSCFLLDMEDSIDGIYGTLKDIAKISQSAGGVGLAVHSIRAAGARIKSTGAKGTGLVPMLRVFSDTARYVDQGGRRKGAFAVYLEPWHADVVEFLDLKKPHGEEKNRARDLFYALWVPDLFFRRVVEDGDWTLFSPDEAPGLHLVFDETTEGGSFTKLYEQYEQEGRGRRTVKASWLLDRIIDAQTESGTPYMLSKDAANRKSNQQNLGVIKSSNLCTEVIQYTDSEEIAVCNLASLSLPAYIVIENGVKRFDHQKLYETTKQVTRNLNRVIDITHYPVPQTFTSNNRHRPIGLGVQGLADTFAQLGYVFDSNEARILNREIFETMYYASMEASCELAQEEGAYSTYEGSPLSKGKFQFDMWKDVDLKLQGGKWVVDTSRPVPLSGRWDWEKLRTLVKEHGVRNSLLMAPMPTASCQTVDTEIITQEGILSYRQILERNDVDVDLIEQTLEPHWIKLTTPVEVQTMNGYKTVEQVYYNGHHEVFKIEMEDGNEFEATANHRFLVNREGVKTWVRVDELTENDDIVNIYEDSGH